MKKLFLGLMAIALASCSSPEMRSVVQPRYDLPTASVPEGEKPIVYVTREITPQSLIKIYEALGVKAEGNVAVKISTGESEKTGYLRPEFIGPLVQMVNGTVVECNTAYPGNRNSTKEHLKVVEERGFTKIAKVDIMDSEGDIAIAVRDTTHIKYDIVGSHLANYDFMINLAHFKGHQMAGMGGVLKNASIGVASSAGKAYIHSSGATESAITMWAHTGNQDGFVESMAAAAQAVHDYFGGKVLYINVMNKMSIDCDCNGSPHEPLIADYGIIASLDPVAVDQAAYDIVTQIHHDEHNNPQPLLDRIAEKHGTHIMEWGEKIGLGTREYKLVSIDE